MTIDGLKINRDNVLSGLRDTVTQFGALERKVTSMVSAARSYGASWQQIGEALDISRQAAWERFADRIGTERAGSVDG